MKNVNEIWAGHIERTADKRWAAGVVEWQARYCKSQGEVGLQGLHPASTDNRRTASDRGATKITKIR